MKPKTFTAEEFTPTQWDSAETKAEFANHFVRFVESDFKQSLFTKKFYNRLSMCFDHIAHYNQGGFWETFFTSDQDKLDFLTQTISQGGYGDPHWTYSDVERVLRQWVFDTGLIDTYQQKANATVESQERAELDRLRTKYPDETRLYSL
jgi:hypothetical protein